MDIFLDNKSILYSKWNKDYTKSYQQKVNLESGNVIWEVDTYFGKPFMRDGYLFGSLKSNLFRIDLNTGRPIWQINLSEKYNSYLINGECVPIDVQGYIGIYNDLLYIKAGSKLILGIEISSGKEKFSYEYFGENILLNNLCLDYNKGLIFSIGSMEYFELSLSSQVGEVVSIKEQVQENNIQATRLGAWEDNIIYFWEGGANSKFGLFDRERRRIEFVQNLNITGYPAIKGIKYGQGKIYVLDGNNSLHIFEQSGYYL